MVTALTILFGRDRGKDVVADGNDTAGAGGCSEELLTEDVQGGDEIFVGELLKNGRVGRSEG